MKKVLLFITALCIIECSYSQTSSGTWDSKTATYVNATHNIKWQLIENSTWVGRPILVESTLLKVLNEDAQILVKLSADKESGLSGDAWNHVSDFESPQVKEIHMLLAKQNGMTYLGTKAVRSQICGIHAVKSRTDMKKTYPGQNQTVHFIEIAYGFCKGTCFYTVSVSALSILEEEIPLFDQLTNELFNRFSID